MSEKQWPLHVPPNSLFIIILIFLIQSSQLIQCHRVTKEQTTLLLFYEPVTCPGVSGQNLVILVWY